MITLRPVEVSEYYINRISKGMSRYFWEHIFSPIFAILKSNTVTNDNSALLQAINAGRIYYEYGAFRTQGVFSNEIAKELEQLGAVYRNSAYYIEKSLIPIQYEQALSLVAAKEAAKIAAVNRLLIGLSDTLDYVSVEDFIESAVQVAFKKLETDIIKSAQEKQVPVIELGIVKPKVKVPKSQIRDVEKYWEDQEEKAKQLREQISQSEGSSAIVDELKDQLREINENAYKNAPSVEIDTYELDAQSKKIAEDYVHNMKYWVKKWEAKNISKMREDMLDLVQKGARVPTIQKYFEDRWGIAKNKAQFLAVNESHLAASIIKATRYQQMGSTRFKWGRSSSKEKRKLHEEYYGKIFEYKNPPIIDEQLSINGLPRQIWNCKCHQEPVIDPININRIINAKRNIFKKFIYNVKNSTQCDNLPWRYRRFGEGQEV